MFTKLKKNIIFLSRSRKRDKKFRERIKIEKEKRPERMNLCITVL
jgi:hypothetical protein